MTDDDDWARDHARGDDPWTSHAAAESMAGRTEPIVAALARVYRVAGDRGLTAEEAADAIGTAGGGAGAWKRVSDLIRAGTIVDSGKVRLGRSGRAQRVLVVAPPDPVQLTIEEALG
jgi:hypothetical protein